MRVGWPLLHPVYGLLHLSHTFAPLYLSPTYLCHATLVFPLTAKWFNIFICSEQKLFFNQLFPYRTLIDFNSIKLDWVHHVRQESLLSVTQKRQDEESKSLYDQFDLCFWQSCAAEELCPLNLLADTHTASLQDQSNLTASVQVHPS